MRAASTSFLWRSRPANVIIQLLLNVVRPLITAGRCEGKGKRTGHRENVIPGTAGQNGNYLSELEAQPGGPEGRPHTTAGSKPIPILGRPQGVRPRSPDPNQCEPASVIGAGRQHPVPGPVSFSRTHPAPGFQLRECAGGFGVADKLWFNHARYDGLRRLRVAAPLFIIG